MQRKLFDDVVEVRRDPAATIAFWLLAYLVTASCSIAAVILFLEWCHGA